MILNPITCQEIILESNLNVTCFDLDKMALLLGLKTVG
ncbi:hypothetical protein LEP1GSC005_1603 [Leptospira santarosai str. ST188]|uniref:Uncharacterized protein n=1 Tax=Leptospira santarosai serovar Arenal str. MAVJ 401 TaxID=1049976 RepID=M6JTK8_9LEPT|nr:hypothetical protein LEP1GSC005_1603 [Leptospira santarosai str. ST188]EMN22953.1 hypothetical protein LEP1GSC063_3405 [Leptospira santarosai serovar Arenal str. MAVJ 401]